MTATAEQPTWRPDDQLIPAIMAGSRVRWTSLTLADRAWAVAGLYWRQGWTAEAIGARLGCGVRAVRAALADPSAVICWLLQEESEHFADELCLVQGELRMLAGALAEATADATRYREQLRRMIDTALVDGSVALFPCGCPRTRYNTYVAPKTGKAGCREHRRRAVAKHRQRARQVSDGLVGTAPG